YAYDTNVARGQVPHPPQMLGLHWVGDLMLECQLDVKGEGGTAHLDLVKGGRHFRCTIDCKSGQAKLSIDGLAGYEPKACTPVRAGSHPKLALANIDRQLVLWVDGSPVEFDTATTYEPLGNDRPVSTPEDPGDLSPAGIGSEGASLAVSQIRLLRDM